MARLGPVVSTSRPLEDEQQQTQQQQQAENGNDFQQQYQAQMSTPSSQQQLRDAYLSTNSFVGGAQMNHHSSTPSHGNFGQQQYGQPASSADQYSYVKLDRDRQQNHLAQHQAQHQAQLAELMNNRQQQQQQAYQTTTPMALTTLAALEPQQEVSQQAEQEARQQQEQAQQQAEPESGGNNNNNGYMVEQVQSRPSVQSGPESLLINESPLQVPILDQQSLISDPNQESHEEISNDDRAKQQQQSQPAGVYQVYQAYYAPKDHKPLPGYVRLSLEEFNQLFRDAEIQYVDRNLNALAQNLINNNNNDQNGSQSLEPTNQYEQQTPGETMKASASDHQSIVVDRRSISDRPSSNSSSSSGSEQNNEPKSDRRLKLGQAVKKIISIRNSRQLAKQTKASKLVMKRVKTPILSTTQAMTTVSVPTITESTGHSTIKAQLILKSTQAPKKKANSQTKQANQPIKKIKEPLVETSSVSRDHGDKKPVKSTTK